MNSNLASLLTTTAWEAYCRPLLSKAGLYETQDLSFGRCDTPSSPMERRLYACDDIDVWFGKIVLANGKDWCWYQVWQKNSIPSSHSSPQRRPDILFVHGTGVHSGTLAGHARRYLDAGFRLIVPDLVNHGYSSGTHVFQRHMRAYTDGLRAVLHDVARRDDAVYGISSATTRSHHQQTFMLGLSFGGTVALHYLIDYPGSLRNSVEVANGTEIPIDGAVVVGPILGYSTTNITMPVYVAYSILALDAIGAGCMELYVPHKKCLDKDPKVYKSLIDEDKRSHQGAFRVGHMLCLNDAVVRLHQEAHAIKHPLFIQQGGQDRVACPRKTFEWIQRTATNDKRMAIYPVCQHVIYLKAKTEEEDQAGRVACIEDNVDWMLARSSLSQPLHPHRYHGSFFLNRLARKASYSPSDSDDLTSSSTSGMATPCPSEESFATEATEYDETDGKPLFASDNFVRITPEQQRYDHPLLARAHKTTLPALAEICPERIYRPKWTLSASLCPFDVNTVACWTETERTDRIRHAAQFDQWSSFTGRD